MPTFVYFLRPEGRLGPVKIGCSRYPASRLRALMAWSPYPLELAVEVPGERRDEKCLHSMFVADHTHGEWFRASGRLTTLIEKLSAGAPLAEMLDHNVPLVDFRDYSTRRSPNWRRWSSYSHRVYHACGYDESRRSHDILRAWRRDLTVTPTAEDFAYIEHEIARGTRKGRRPAFMPATPTQTSEAA